MNTLIKKNISYKINNFKPQITRKRTNEGLIQFIWRKIKGQHTVRAARPGPVGKGKSPGDWIFL